MSELKPNIHDEANGLDYVLAGDYYIPAIEPLRKHPYFPVSANAGRRLYVDQFMFDTFRGFCICFFLSHT